LPNGGQQLRKKKLLSEKGRKENTTTSDKSRDIRPETNCRTRIDEKAAGLGLAQ
jgi:hypothetical protein